MRRRLLAPALGVLTAALLAAPLLSFAAAGEPAPGSPLFMWTARGDGAVIHLLGSIHVGAKDFFPLDDAIERAFAGSEAVAAELDISDPTVQAQAAQALMGKGMLPEGKTLQDVVPAETWKGLTAYLDQRGIPVAMFERMRPALVAMVLAVQETQRLGYDPNQGIDLYLLRRAKPEKRIIALETVDEQVDALLPEDLETGSLLLADGLAESDSLGTIFAEMLAAWQSGDAEAMDALVHKHMLDDPRLEAYSDRILTQRNRRMGQKLLASVSPGDTLMVVVGSGHLLGPTGLPEMLAARGYTVEQDLAEGRTLPAPAEPGEQPARQPEEETAPVH